MPARYGLRGKPLTAWLLPVLYVHRNARGAWKILSGKSEIMTAYTWQL